MYFITDKKELNFWSNDLLKISKFYKENIKENLLAFEQDYSNLKPISKEYLEFLNKNPIKPNDLKIGDTFETFTINRPNETYKVLEIEYNEQDEYYTHICEVLQTGEKINYGLFWTKYVNLLKED